MGIALAPTNPDHVYVIATGPVGAGPVSAVTGSVPVVTGPVPVVTGPVPRVTDPEPDESGIRDR